MSGEVITLGLQLALVGSAAAVFASLVVEAARERATAVGVRQGALLASLLPREDGAAPSNRYREKVGSRRGRRRAPARPGRPVRVNARRAGLPSASLR